MYTHVLVPLDGSDRALAALGPAQRLCRLHGAPLWLVTVALPDTTAEEIAAIGIAVREIPTDPVADVTVLRGNDAAAELARLHLDNAGALLCMTTRARRALGRKVFGSVAAELVRLSDGAVVLVGPSCDVHDTSTVRRLLVCLDGTPAGEAVLPWATRWSLVTGVPLALVHVIYPLVEPAARVPPLEEQLDELAYVRRLALSLERDGHRVADVTVQHPSAPDAIADLAGDVPGALVAIAIPEASPAIGAIDASTVAQLLRSSTVPVILAGDRANRR